MASRSGTATHAPWRQTGPLAREQTWQCRARGLSAWGREPLAESRRWCLRTGGGSVTHPSRRVASGQASYEHQVMDSAYKFQKKDIGYWWEMQIQSTNENRNKMENTHTIACSGSGGESSVGGIEILIFSRDGAFQISNSRKNDIESNETYPFAGRNDNDIWHVRGLARPSRRPPRARARLLKTMRKIADSTARRNKK